MAERTPTMQMMIRELVAWYYCPDEEALLQMLVLDKVESGTLPELLDKRMRSRAAAVRQAQEQDDFPEFAPRPMNCRHAKGTDDCPPACLLIYGDRYTAQMIDLPVFGQDPNKPVMQVPGPPMHEVRGYRPVEPIFDEPQYDCEPTWREILGRVFRRRR